MAEPLAPGAGEAEGAGRGKLAVETVVGIGRGRALGMSEEEKAKSELPLEGKGVVWPDPGSEIVVPLLAVVDRDPMRCLRLPPALK